MASRCIGKSFAIANMKVALVVLLRRFSFELPDGRETKFEPVHAAVTRVKTVGQKGCKVPMRIRRVD
jgi:cytochrome P450